jgi:hypothetical protein
MLGVDTRSPEQVARAPLCVELLVDEWLGGHYAERPRPGREARH